MTSPSPNPSALREELPTDDEIADAQIAGAIAMREANRRGELGPFDNPIFSDAAVRRIEHEQFLRSRATSLPE